MTEPELSVVVCTYNRAGLLPHCLDSLADQALAKERYEVIVVDNNSTDSTADVAARYVRKNGNFRLVFERTQGLSHARNRGLKEARGEYIAYIDDDAIAARDWCRRILSAFKTVEPRPAVVGGEILPWYEQEPPEWFVRGGFEVRSWGPEARFMEMGKGFSGFSGSNMAFQRRVLEESGGFSPALGMAGATMWFGEELELFRRISEKEPLFWYDPAIRVRHFTPACYFKLGYNIRRAIKGGEASALIQRSRTVEPRGRQRKDEPRPSTPKALLCILTAEWPFMTKVVKITRGLASRVGFVVGTVRIMGRA